MPKSHICSCPKAYDKLTSRRATVTEQPPKLGTFERLPGSSYTAIAVQPYGILVDSMDSNLLWLQTGLKPSATPSNFETSDGFYRVYELLEDDSSSTPFSWSPSNLQGPEHASVLTLLFDTSNISPQDELYLQNAVLNPSRFNFVNTMERTSLADHVAAGALFLATADSTKKPSLAAKAIHATLLEALNLPRDLQVSMVYRRDSEASEPPQELEVAGAPVFHLAQDSAVTATVTVASTPPTHYPKYITTGCPHSSASHNRMTVFGLVSVAAMLFAL